MPRIPVVIAILCLIFFADGTQAEETQLVEDIMPAVKGYVLSIDLPATDAAEKWDHFVNPDDSGFTIIFSSKAAYFSLKFRVYKKPGNFEKYIIYRKKISKSMGEKVYEQGFNNALGRKTFFYLSSNPTISIDGKEIIATKPTQKHYVTLFDDRVTVEFNVYVGPRQVPPLALTESLPLFERIARTIKVVPASEMAPEQLSQYYSTPNVKLSQRRDYYLNATLVGTLPPGWEARVVTVEHASGSSENGRLEVEFTPTTKYPSGRYEKLKLLLEGVQLSNVFSVAGFIDTAKTHLASVLADPKNINTPEDVALPASLDGSGFCSMNRRVRRGEATRKVYVNTYTGKDRDGQDSKVRIYTAGGFTMACNIIYIADPGTFDEPKKQERIGAIVKSLSVVVDSPALMVR